jgi:sodium pump decarboxylase gamma subunit
MNNVGLITISGIFTVFTVLIILMIVYYLFGYFVTKGNKKNVKNIPSPKKLDKKPEQIVKSETKVPEDSDEEIAAITAAVYSFIDSSKYRIKNISKSNTNKRNKSSNSRWGSVSPVNIWRTNR